MVIVYDVATCVLIKTIPLLGEDGKPLTDEIGKVLTEERRNEVFCKPSGVQASEWHEAGRKGLKTTGVLTVFWLDYDGENIVEFEGKRYGVYRTYPADSEHMELHLEEKAGI